ncbi:MAG TPA: hypothetical protein VMU21_12195 [Thermodesulfovibrionales bacterium]|nr:hypothetical protein [Thermodesulfovibrionales bacterium]
MEDWRHFLLYAKNYYLKTETISDLLKILSHETGLDPRSVKLWDVYEVLAGRFVKYTRGDQKKDFFMRMFSEGDSVKIGDVVLQLLAALSVQKVRDGETVLIDLGEPDPSVLPLNKY